MISRAVDAGFQQGMFQHREEMEQFLMWLGPVGAVLEVGAHRGGTAAMFCELTELPVVSLDLPDGPWGGVGLESADERDKALSARYPNYRPVRGDSHDVRTRKLVVGALGGHLVDLLFIDGDHSHIGVAIDFRMYRVFVKAGGVIAFHDVNDTQFHKDRGVTVYRFWEDLVAADKRVFSVGREWGGIGAVRV